MSKLTSNKSDEIKKWLDSVDEEEPCCSVVESSVLETQSSSESGEELEMGEWTHGRENKYEHTRMLPPMTAISFNNINISNSTNVYLGHIYKVNGNLNINVIQCGERQQEDEKSPNDVPQPQKSEVLRPACLIFPRYRWLAMDPLTPSKQILEPVGNVVIGYTCTTSSTVQARNIGIIRDFQTLNVEAQGFNDIIYNFLIGCDGVVYEGRGWGVEGDHTQGYNHISIGVAFVGNFKRNQPTERALNACQNLLIRQQHLSTVTGLLAENPKASNKDDLKFITFLKTVKPRFDDYVLKQCQCSSNTNFDALFEVFKKWDHFYEVQNHNE